MQKYPIGIQDFQKLRENGFMYIDKTKYLFDLVKNGGQYFLSRPRRFGKSLLISTLKQFFLGNSELFEGLWIADKIRFKKYPIIHLDFSSMDYHNLGLEKVLQERLWEQVQKYQMSLEKETSKEMFRKMILELSESQKVVILIDEYDKPIIDYLENPKMQIAKENRDILKNFYGVIKGLDAQIQFFLLTGISKFSKVSIFSELNHLNDLTLNPHFSSMLGYTQGELEKYFTDEITQFAQKEELTREIVLEKIKFWYNGYNWLGKEKVYNPFSILNFFNTSDFKNFWFETGTPTFLVNLIKEKELYNFENEEVSTSLINSYEIENLTPHTLLFQAGYLTIKEVLTHSIYLLNYPNMEVKEAFYDYLLRSYSQFDNVGGLVYQMAKAFESNDLEKVLVNFKALLANIPYEIFAQKQELYYQAIFYLALRLIGSFVEAEVSTNVGRIDAVISTNEAFFILDFKINDTAQKALEQIKAKKYDEKYMNLGKKICLIGASCQEKTVKEWLVEWI